MPGTVVLVVLCGALLHASWNAVVKSGGDKFLTAVMVTTISGLMATAILPFLQPPLAASWPYLGASVVLQTIYLVLVARAYQSGEMSLAYPLMRGTAPMIVALVSAPLIGEHLPVLRWLGVALVCFGVLAMAFDSLRPGRNAGHSVTIALVNACFIASYTVSDGIGVRKSDSAIAYTLWIFVLHGIPLLIWALIHSAGELKQLMQARWKAGIFGAVATLGSYGAALWAMSLDVPVASVAALRETSILFAAGISIMVFDEKIGRWRWLGVAMICGGVATIRMS